MRYIDLILLFIITLAILKFITLLELSGFWKFILSVVYLYITALYVKARIKDVKEELPGLLMWRTKRWLEDLKRLLHLGEFLETLSTMVFFTTFGLLGIFLAKWLPIRKRIVYFIGGMALLYGLLLIYPMALLKLPVQGSGTSSSNPLMLALVLISGLMGIIVYSFSNAIFHTLVALISQSETPKTLTPLLPGITLPFFEGIIALGLVLVVHELSHAILSLKYKIPVKSTGLLTYGILPVGAFVEPDEEAFEKAPSSKKILVLLGGPSINLFLGIVFFGIFILFLLVTVPWAEEGCYVVKGLEPGTIIKTIDNVPCIYAIAHEGSVMETNKGTMNWSSNIYYYPIGKDSFVRYYSLEPLNFLYNLLYMLFSLNVLLGLANLFPVMFFDGGQLMLELGRLWEKENIGKAIVGIFSLMLLLLIVGSFL